MGSVYSRKYTQGNGAKMPRRRVASTYEKKWLRPYGVARNVQAGQPNENTKISFDQTTHLFFFCFFIKIIL